MSRYPSNSQFPLQRTESPSYFRDNNVRQVNPFDNRGQTPFIGLQPWEHGANHSFAHQGSNFQAQYQRNRSPVAERPRAPFRPSSWRQPGMDPAHQDPGFMRMPGLSNLRNNGPVFHGNRNLPPFESLPHGSRFPAMVDNFTPFGMPSLPPFPPNMPFNRPVWQASEGLHQSSQVMLSNKPESHSKEIVPNDDEFVKKWLLQKNIKKESTDTEKTGTIKLKEFKEELKNYLKCISELKMCMDVLMRFVDTEEDKWQEIVEKTESIKENLHAIQGKLFENEYILDVSKKIKRRQRKRERQKNARERRAKEKVEKERRTIMLHQKIDEWRHEIVSKINAKRMVDSLKSDAGQSLAEVRRKLADGSKWLEKVDGTMELRGIRRQTALQRGIFIFGDQDKKFEERLNKIREIIKRRLELYKDEEKTLRVMLEEEQEQMKREDDSKRRALMEKEHVRLFGYNPLLECRRYWLQAEETPMPLVQIRRLWDVHLAPHGDPIPDGWVSPEVNKNSLWYKYLKRKK